jgi:bacterioferritin-associated ferredoxin
VLREDADRMIVCSCSRITERDILQTIEWMRAADPHTLITPGKIYRALGRSPECGGCIRLFVEKMRASDRLSVPGELRGLRAESEARNGR